MILDVLVLLLSAALFGVMAPLIARRGTVALAVLTRAEAGLIPLGGVRGAGLEAECEFVERDANPIMHGQVSGEGVVAAPQVLNEGVTGRDGARGGQSFQSAHRSEPALSRP